MKKSTIKTKLDNLISKQIRKQGYCSKCKNNDYNRLHCCHIFSRKLMSVRFDKDNLICLCSSCHAKFHDRPILFSKFCEEYLGEEKYSQLIMKASILKKWTLWELQELHSKLEEEWKAKEVVANV